MKIKIEINNLTDSPITKNYFQKIFCQIFSQLKLKNLENKTIFLSLALVSSEEIKKLNKIYRKRNASTDVLSFCEFEKLDELEKTRETEVFLGEIILCYTDIEEYAEKENKNLKKELGEVFAHGVLHTLGFSHCSKMFFVQKNAVEKVLENFIEKEKSNTLQQV